MTAEGVEAKQTGGEAGRKGCGQEGGERAVVAKKSREADQGEAEASEGGEAGVAKGEGEEAAGRELEEPVAEVVGVEGGGEAVVEVFVEGVGGGSGGLG